MVIKKSEFLRRGRYFLFFVSIVIFVYSIQIFVQNFNMDKTISLLKGQQYSLSGETFWLKNYYEPYLKSKYSLLIFKHKNGIVSDNENLVKVINPDLSDLDYVIYSNEKSKISWQDFFSSLFKKV
jgi:hypothetical protein